MISLDGETRSTIQPDRSDKHHTQCSPFRVIPVKAATVGGDSHSDSDELLRRMPFLLQYSSFARASDRY